MSTLNRYIIHFGLIGLVVLLVGIVLMIADGGELLKPIMLITITLLDACFVFLMALFYNSFAKPVLVTIMIENKTEFLAQLEEISARKWGRKVVVTGEDKVYFKFGNRYKDWLTTPIKLSFQDNRCRVLLPSYYEEDILRIAI